MKQSNVEKLMKFVIEHKEEISHILKFLNEQEGGSISDSDKQDPGYSDEDVPEGKASAKGDGADEDVDNVMTEGDAEKAGTEITSDGNSYPEDGLGGKVEDPTLKAKAAPKASCCKEVEVEISEEEELEELDEEGGTASAPAPGGASVGAPAPQGSQNTGIARVKTRLGEKPCNESISPEEKEVLDMIAEWKERKPYRIIGL